MSILTNSPSPNKQNPDWSFQVKVGRGRADTGAHHRAIDVAVDLFESGAWDGRGQSGRENASSKSALSFATGIKKWKALWERRSWKSKEAC